LRGEKTTLYEGGIRVPLIPAMPVRSSSCSGSDDPVSGIDFYPTLCTFFGVSPSDPAKVDGEDLSDLLFRRQSPATRNLFWNFPCYTDPADPAKTPRSALRRGDWKIIHRYEDDGYELYNLKEDIGEARDLSKSHPQKLEEMRRQLEASYARFGAVPSLPDNPDYQPKP